MGETDIRTFLKEARDKAWGDQTLVQRAADMARVMHAPTLNRLRAEERTFLAAISRLVADASSRRFVEDLCSRVFRRSESEAAENLRQMLREHGGVPTFFSSMARLRLKAAAMAPRSVQGAALSEVKRVFRATFGEFVLPTNVGKVTRRAEGLAKEGMRLALHPLSPAVFGRKSAERYEKYLEAILTKQKGVGIVVQPWRLWPGLSPCAPEVSARELAERLQKLLLLSLRQGEACPVVIATQCSDTLPVIIAALKRVMDQPEMDQADVALELPGYLKSSVSYLRELVEWAQVRSRRGARPIKALLVKGSHLDEEKRCAARYGTEAQLCTTKLEAEASFIRLVNAAISCSEKVITPVIGTHELTHICYAVLCWARSKREGLPPLCFIYGLGNHLGRQFAKLGAPVLLQAGIASEETETRAFERHLLQVVQELSRPGGYMTSGYAAEASGIDWSAKVKPLMVAISPRSDMDRSVQESTGGYAPGNLGCLLERAEVDACYAAARVESERRQSPIPLMMGGAEYHSPLTFIHRSLTVPGLEDYRFFSADYGAVNQALELAQAAVAAPRPSLSERTASLQRAARELRKRRAEFTALLMRDAGFTLKDAQIELRDAMDACRFYAVDEAAYGGMQDGTEPVPLGVVVVAAGVVHPLAEAVAGIAAAWVGGNAIIYKPAAYSTLVGTRLTELLTAVGIELLCLPCVDNEISRRLMTDPRVDALVCSGSPEQAHALMVKAPVCSALVTPAQGASIYLSPRCDWQRALREIMEHAFRRTGQGVGSPHIILVHARLYDHAPFFAALEDAASSLTVGAPWREDTDMGPLAAPLSDAELRLLTEERESWLLRPHPSELHSLIWSPGICTGVSPDEALVAHGQNLPLMGVIRVENMQEAIAIQRKLARGSRAILYTRDTEETERWLQGMDCRWLAVNCCPSPRPGLSPLPTWQTSLRGAEAPMAGGRNYAARLCYWQEQTRPSLRSARRHLVFDPKDLLPPSSNAEETMRLSAAADSISYWWEQEFGVEQELPSLPGERAALTYHPMRVCLRIEKAMTDADIAIALMVAMQAHCHVQLSASEPRPWLTLFAEQYGVPLSIRKREEFEEGFASLAAAELVLRDPAATPKTLERAGACGLPVVTDPVLANGRLEFLHYLEERVRIISTH